MSGLGVRRLGLKGRHLLRDARVPPRVCASQGRFVGGDHSIYLGPTPFHSPVHIS
jgi:hypothetical protein